MTDMIHEVVKQLVFDWELKCADFHCHLGLYPDHAEAVARCKREGVFTLALTTMPRAWPRNHELSATTLPRPSRFRTSSQLDAERGHEIAL
ncbi:hypothetical protein [Bradyrhizobium sp. LA6.7]|uniref:hypothetical protein n=1 Tax=unclassified Bradyrhizobium TaxID=2631580 RepID=UPI00339941E3